MDTPSSSKQTSIAKAMVLLRELGRLSSLGDVKLGDLVRATGFNKATAHRLPGELRKCGLVEQQPTGGTYGLGKMILVLNAQYHAGLDLRGCALPVLEKLGIDFAPSIKSSGFPLRGGLPVGLLYFRY